jgi:2-polyprenyl-6-methoxyphenol hydroxylase-like FAD-dependent oxidoreductase
MTFLTDGLVRAFSTQNRFMARARSFGFGAVNHCPPLKNFKIRHAMGV